MKCTEVRALFSSYLDGAVTGVEMHEVSAHLHQCAACQPEYALFENTRTLVSSLGRRTPPPHLALKIRVALSNERSHNALGVLQRYMVRLENAFHGVVLPATAGILFPLLFFFSLVGLFVPAQWRGNYDVPTAFYTPPRPERAVYPVLDFSVVIE